MDFWKSEYEEGSSTSSALAGFQELIDSPNLSRDSIEYSSDDPNSLTSDPADSVKVRQALKTTFLAKRRLQAYSAVNKFKQGNVKEDKDGTSKEKPHQRTTIKKVKKTLYPDDAAKAVIRDIENLKRAGFGGPPIPPSVLSISVSVPADIIPIEPVIPISLGKLNIDKSPSISLSSDLEEENLFKKREIKCRNIRKSATSSRRSPSPKNSIKNERHGSNGNKEKKEYPSNWTEYKELNLDPQKDALLKSKLFRKPRSKHFLLKRYFNFETPPAPIEIFKCQPINGEASWITFPYLRSTASKPQILYSTNQHVTSPGYLTRKQLFSLIPPEREALIERLWKSSSRYLPSNKKYTSRKWYPRNWRKFDNTEVKLLEKSVGLSFLQSYSDEEEEEEEEEEIADDNNEEVDREVNVIENKVSTSPSATPQERPKNFGEETPDNIKNSTFTGINSWDELNTGQYENASSAIVKTPPLEEKEEGEVSGDESPVNIFEDEYEKTKNELASLEEALKESSLNNFDITLVSKDEKNQTEKKKNTRSEKESKSKNKKKSKKDKNKSRQDSEDETDSSKSERESLKKKKQKNKKKYFKDKAEKEKRRKSKKKMPKRIKKFDSNSESESYEEESDLDEHLYKKNKKKKKKKSTYKSKKERVSKELGCKVQDRKNSVDITHEGYEDDVKFFTARFVKENDLKGKLRHKKEDADISGIIQTKNKTNIDIGELTLPSKADNDKTSNRRSKWDSEAPKNEKKHSEKNKVKDDTGKEEIKKYDIKVDLLKKNEEYLKEQDKLKLKQKKTSSDITSSSIIKTPETSFKSEDEGLILSKSYKQEKHKCKGTHLSDVDTIAREQEKYKLNKDLRLIRSSDDDMILTDKKVIKKGDTKTDNKTEHSDHTEREESERHHKRNVNEEELGQKRLSEHLEKEDTIIIQKQPDWDQLKHKRKRYICDATQDKFDKPKEYSKVSEGLKNAEDFDLEKELPIIHVKQEIDSDDEIFGSGQQINTSWETDEEFHEVVERYDSGVVDRSLEIPLNIKHFTRREIKVEKDASDKDEESKQRKNSHDLTVDDKTQTPSLKQKIDAKDTTLEDDSQTPAKKRRWDIKSLDSAVSTPKIKTEVIDLEANICHNAVTLENEYEEFLKAVTSTKKDNQNKPIVIDSSSDSSVTFNEGLKSERKFEIGSSLVNEQILPKNSSSFKPVISNIDDLISKPKETQVLDIPMIHIPLPPVKPEEIKPVPVPLPNLTVFDLNKPLINLSLSANVTQNITLSLATSATSISAPITSSTDISKTSVEISTPVPKDTVVNVNTIPLPTSKTLNSVTSFNSPKNSSDLQLTHIPVSSKPDILHPVKIQLPKEKSITSHVSSDEVDKVLVNRKWEGIPTKQKIVFATLTLPSKKQLINNSNLNLDDSDNDDQSIIEELKRKKLEALIEDNKKEALIEERKKQVAVEEKVETTRAKSPVSTKHISKDEAFRKISPHKSYSRHESSPKRKRDSPIKRRESSPRRRSPRRRSPRRSPRRRSPTRKRSPHRRRSPRRRSASPRKGRSISPRKRKSPSPRRKRSISPKNRHSPRRTCSISPKNRNRSVSPKSKSSRHSPSSHRNQSPKPKERKKLQVPPQISSPFGGPKRSVADSTISDDQLPQTTSHDDYGDTLFLNCPDKNRVPEYDSPKRIPLDMRISQVLGYAIPNDASPKPTSSTSFNYDAHQQSYQYSEQYSNIQSQVTTPTMRNSLNCQGKRQPQNCYRQVGNMLQIVPNDDIIDIPMPQPVYQTKPSPLSQVNHHPIVEPMPPTNIDIKPQIVQVGNMLQIVPTEMVPMELIPVPPPQIESGTETTEQFEIEKPLACTSPEKPSAEAAMLQKIAERRAERESRRQERERRRKEKEKRHKEKEKARQARLKIKTENMIKKALEMEQEEDTETDVAGENPIKWPPLPIVVTHTVFKEAGKSILLTSGSRKFDISSEEKKIKIVQFADGVKPGEGTSPSAGEELSSPPPPKKKLPKEKRYKKVKLDRKSAKKKVKVKIIKKPPSPSAGSDSDNNLPPPSPPPGSPPPHIFPPRIKVNPVNNVPAAYLATIIQTAQQQQQHQQQIQRQQQQQVQQYQSNVYCPPINLLMAPPPPPQGHPPPQTIPPHQQSPHGTTVPPSASSHGPQGHFHHSLPLPPPVSPHNHYSSGSSGQSGHHRHY